MQLTVNVERVVYPPATTDDATWFILATDKGTCKGKMAWRPKDGERLILEGEYRAYQGNKEFGFDGATISVPTNERDRLHYVAERTNGIGPALERVIWDRLGNEWADVDKCAGIPKMTPKICAEMRVQIEALKSNAAQANAVAWLVGHGATMNMAAWAWATWGAQMVGVVSSDPFRLCELPNYGFADVDKAIRQAFGIADDDMRRIRAGLLYALRRLTDAGDTLITWESLYKRACGMLAGHAELIAEAAVELRDAGDLCTVDSVRGMALKADYWAEKSIAEFVEGVVA